MTPTGRIFVGLAGGVALAVLIVPRYRERILTPYRAETVETVLRPPIARPPKTLADAADWLRRAADRTASSRPLGPEELRTLRELVRQGRALEPRNAFWKLCDGVLVQDEAVWERAARSDRYDAHDRNDPPRRQGAWRMAIPLLARRADVETEIARLARRTVAEIGTSLPRDVRRRVACVRSADLVRQGASTPEGTLRAIAAIEYASYPPRVAVTDSPKTLVIARNALVVAATKTMGPTAAEDVLRCFRQADAARFLLEPEAIGETRGRLAAFAGLVGAAPLAILLLGAFATTWRSVRTTLPRFAAPAAGSAFLVAGAWVAGLGPLGWIACAIAPWIEAVVPRQRRSADEPGMGPLFRLSQAFLAGAIAIGTILAVAGSAPASKALNLITDGDVTVGAIALRALVVAAVAGWALVPLWAVVQHRDPAEVRSVFWRGVARRTFRLAIVLMIVAVPALLVIDARLEDEIRRAWSNEPIYHMSR